MANTSEGGRGDDRAAERKSRLPGHRAAVNV